MPETDIHQPGLGLLRAGAEATELAQTASVLVTGRHDQDPGAGR